MPPASEVINVVLNPGEYFVGDARYRIKTVLGSCVSIMLWHPVRKIGALSHFMLMSRKSNSDDVNNKSELNAKYGDEAMILMLRGLEKLYVNPGECHGKIFGGGNMFPNQRGLTKFSVGQRNGEAARKLLQQHRIQLVSENLYGIGHRQIIFEVKTGNVWIRQFDLTDTSQPTTKDFI